MAKNTRTVFFVIADFFCFNASYLLAYLIALTEKPTPLSEAVRAYFDIYPTGFLILVAVKLLAMYVFSVYRIMFEYAGSRDFQRVALSIIASTLASVTAAALVGIEHALLPTVIFFSFVFDMALALTIRLMYVRQTTPKVEDEDSEGQSLRRRYSPPKKSAGRVMVIGKDRAAADLIAEMQANEGLGRKPEIIIDDDRSHIGDTLLGVEVQAGRTNIKLRARRQAIDEIIIAKPSASKRMIATLLRECVKTRCQINMLPLTRVSGAPANAEPAALANLRKPTVADLLGRDRPRVDHREIGDHLKGRVVLVIGGAGVFGSELCRRIIRYRPRRLIALDIDEDGLTMIGEELGRYSTAEMEFRTVVASVRDAAMMRRVFVAFRPHIIFHAAELKQIPLAQSYPRESFLTNVLGLKTACDLADEYMAEQFILCSTVRAADPTNVAAECKRMAELYIDEKNEKSQTCYSTVRFPNLIEGRGNVIAVFGKQIEQGGPVTVTDKDIVRRFISAEEAALLTAVAAAIAKGGEIFELGPGEAIGILDLAEAMVRLAGKAQNDEIEIIVTQLRPGERLFEDIGKEIQRSSVTASDRIWLVEERSGVKLPHWSQLWCIEPDRIDDAAVMDILHMVFPTYKKNAGNAPRGERIENE